MMQKTILTRGVYIAPWRDEATDGPVVVLIDRHHRCVHQLTAYAEECREELLGRAANLLNVLDPPRRSHPESED